MEDKKKKKAKCSWCFAVLKWKWCQLFFVFSVINLIIVFKISVIIGGSFFSPPHIVNLVNLDGLQHSPAVLYTSCCADSFGARAVQHSIQVKNIVLVCKITFHTHAVPINAPLTASLTCLLCIHLVLMHSDNLAAQLQIDALRSSSIGWKWLRSVGPPLHSTC